jgi:hypothetical protein
MNTSDKTNQLLGEILTVLKSIDYTLRFGKKKRTKLKQGFTAPNGK